MYKIFQPYFSLYSFANFMEKEPSTKFYGFMIRLCLNISYVIHANEHTCKRLEFLVYVILFQDEKGSF